MKIDLNCDLGESFGHFKIGNDDVVIQYVTSVNIACGFHAGDPLVMEKTVKMALENNVEIGAHPGFPDLMGFGRRNMVVSPSEAKAYVIYQISALNGFVKAQGGKMQHVKPHGAFYNMAAKDYHLARAIAEGVYAVDSDLILMGLAGGELIRAGKDVGLRTASEVFSDRAYNLEGTLAPRGIKGAVIHDIDAAVNQVQNMVLNGKVATIEGGEVELQADSICVHGDNDEAVELVKQIRNSLKEANVEVKALSK
ncbi:LamB/YcsF family protein [Bacillus sp. Bva_UNVM-123]|uniref:LamB/YcsF family protein n=1 Tax=Bacillus sp. Bva_UNVM-123 TaxID=2829798 RepID=UPI00391F7613